MSEEDKLENAPQDRQVLCKFYGAQGSGKSTILSIVLHELQLRGYAIYIADDLNHELLVDKTPT